MKMFVRKIWLVHSSNIDMLKVDWVQSYTVSYVFHIYNRNFLVENSTLYGVTPKMC